MSLINEKCQRSISGKQLSREDIESFVYKWNLNYPIDRWWREKHKIVFNSPEHRVVSFLDMYIEWVEDQIYSKATLKSIKNLTYKLDDWLEEREEVVDEAAMMREWENMDLSKLDG